MIQLRLQSKASSPRSWDYGVAGRRLTSDATVPELEAFRTRGPRISEPQQTDGDPPVGSAQAVFSGEVELGPRSYLLDCCWNGAGFELAVANLGRFAIDRWGLRITLESAPESRDSAGSADLVLGPFLTLALALQGVFCLHASAVEIEGAAVAFLGVSGAGKSTLARTLPGLSGGRFRCIGDDALPVTLDAGCARALPRFPQLKYRPDRQPGAGVAPSLPLAAIYLLESPRAGSGGVAVEPVTGHAAVLALVRHTHSARLFCRELLRRHTDGCAELASRVPVRRLIYPRQLEILPRVETTLTAVFAGDAGGRQSSLGGQSSKDSRP